MCSKRYKFTNDDCRRGGRSTSDKIIPSWICPRCSQSFSDAKQLAITGHLGLHGYADKYTAGDLDMARKTLGLLGIAATDPFPANGAFAHAHEFAEYVRQVQQEAAQDGDDWSF